MKTILLQLDTDTHPSVFDRVVAVDSDVSQLFSYGGITPENVEPLVHGVMFTRGGDQLKNSAIFIGGSDVIAGERVLKKVRGTFFGPVHVSVMHDSNGCNTTASAAVLCAKKHLDFTATQALVLGGTGPVGRRVVELLARENCKVAVASRKLKKAEQVCETLAMPSQLQPCALTEGEGETSAKHWLKQSQLIIACGAAGVQFFEQTQWQTSTTKVAIDLNAVPPEGLAGISMMDKAKEISGTLCYGAIGVGGLKMKIHKAAVQSLFQSNNTILDTVAIYQLGEKIS